MNEKINDFAVKNQILKRSNLFKELQRQKSNFSQINIRFFNLNMSNNKSPINMIFENYKIEENPEKVLSRYQISKMLRNGKFPY